MEAVTLFLAFQLKHFVCDFPLQTAYQWKNKGRYGHPGGILHAALHGFGTLLICLAFGLPVWLSLADALVHYHIDWTKVRLNARWGLRPDNSEYFWWLLGFDQLLHQLTYIGILAYGS